MLYEVMTLLMRSSDIRSPVPDGVNDSAISMPSPGSRMAGSANVGVKMKSCGWVVPGLLARRTLVIVSGRAPSLET